MNPASSNDSGHDTHIGELGSKGIRQREHLEATDDGEPTSTDDFRKRLEIVEAGFGQALRDARDVAALDGFEGCCDDRVAGENEIVLCPQMRTGPTKA